MDLRQVINNLKQLADYCDGVASGNVSHKIAHLKYGIINISESLELNAKALELGWRPASELPKEKDVEVIMLVDVSSPQFTGAPLIRVPIFGRYINGWPKDVNVKWWCYPPKEE